MPLRCCLQNFVQAWFCVSSFKGCYHTVLPNKQVLLTLPCAPNSANNNTLLSWMRLKTNHFSLSLLQDDIWIAARILGPFFHFSSFHSGWARDSYGSNLMHHDKRLALAYHLFQSTSDFTLASGGFSPDNASCPFLCVQRSCDSNW